jgi:WD40 repeat protein
MVDTGRGGKGGGRLVAKVLLVVAVLGGLGAAGLHFGQRAYKRNQAEQARAEALRRAQKSADAGRHLLGRGDLAGAAREYLAAYELGLEDTSVRFLLPWLSARLDLAVAELAHDKEVTVVAFSTDGRRALTGSLDKTLRIWEVPSGKLLRRLVGHTAAITAASYSSDGKRVLSMGADATCRLFAAEGDGQKDALIATLVESAGQPWSCRFSPDGDRIVTVANDTSVRLWDGKTGQPVGTLGGHQGQVLLASFSADGQRLVTAAAQAAFLWDARSGKLIAALRGHTENVKDAVFSPDGSRIVTTSADETARLWDGKTGQFLMLLEGHSGTVYSATFTLAGGKAIMTISADGTARLWDSQTGQPLFLPVGHPRYSQILALSRDGGRMVSLNESGVLELWDRILGHMRASLSVGASDGSSDAAVNPKEAAKTPVAFSPNGRRIATGGADGIGRLWDGRTGQALFALKGHHGRVQAVAFSPDSSLLLTGSADGTARLWRTQINRYPRPIEGHQTEVTSISFSRDGSRLLTASRDGITRLWDTASGDQTLSIDGPRRAIDRAFFTSDGERVVTQVIGGSGSAGRTPCVVRVLDSRSGEVRAAFGDSLDLGRALAVSPAGDRVVTASALPDGDNDVQLHELSATPRLIAKLVGHNSFIAAAAFSSDGKLLATASDDGALRIWDGKSGQLVRVLEEAKGQAVRAVTFSSDGRLLLTGTADRAARLYDAVSAAELGLFSGQVGAVRSVYFGPDGERALSIDSGDRAWLWSVRERRLVGALAIYRTGNKGMIATAWSPDGSRIASAGEELRIYDGRTGVPLVSLDSISGEHVEVFTAVAFGPDGSLLATGSQSGAVKLWDVHLESRPAARVAEELAPHLRQ